MKSIKDPAETRKIEGFSRQPGGIKSGWLSSEIVCKGTRDKIEEGPEEDETRQPRPDEPEEYWREKINKIICFIANEQTDYKKIIEEKREWPPDERWFFGYIFGMKKILEILEE